MTYINDLIIYVLSSFVLHFIPDNFLSRLRYWVISCERDLLDLVVRHLGYCFCI